MMKRNLRFVVFAVIMFALLTVATFLPASAQLSQWRSLNPTRDGLTALPAPYLYSVKFLNPNIGWAVGGDCDIYAAFAYPCTGFALYWDGARWRQVVVPPDSGTLTSVFIVGQNDVWAVGTRPDNAFGMPTVLHWDGTSWVQVQTIVSLSNVQDLYDIFILPSGTDGWAVGTSDPLGVTPTNVLRWSGTWPTGAFSDYLPALGTPDILRSVSLLSGTQGWIVGHTTVGPPDDPSIFKWDGASWIDAVTDPALTPPPNTGDLFSVYPVSSSDAWAVGAQNAGGQSTIIRWNGASWTGPLAAPTSNIDYRSVLMVNSNYGWIAGQKNPTTNEGLLLRWNGVAWSPVRSGITENLNDIFMLSGGAQGAAVGDAETIIHWDGSTWFTETSPTSTSLNAVAMVTPNQGWAVGAAGTIFKYDGTWSHYETLPGSVDLFGLNMRSGTDGWIVGDSPGAAFPPTILRWNGATWTAVTPIGVALGETLYSVDTLSATESWAVGSGTVLPSATMLKWDGSLWTSVPSGTPLGTDLYSIDMVSSTDGWAVGCADPPVCSIPMIVRWNGLAWSAATPPVGSQGLTDIFMLSATNGWAVGYAPIGGGQTTIIHWDGVQWTTVPGPVTNAGGFLSSLHMVSAQDGWAVGHDPAVPASMIVHWDGLTWNVVATLPVPPTMAVALRSIFMVAPLDGWIVGDDGLILKYGPESVPTTSTTSTSTTVTTTGSTATTSTTTTTSITPSPVPGFPIESILAGLLGGLIALTVIRRRRKP